MPELPEIETIKRGISQLNGQTIKGLNVRNHSLRYAISETLAIDTVGQTILDISRRAKYLILKLEQGVILIHLGMSGRLTLLNDLTFPLKKHDHFELLFDKMILRYNDPRRFGMVLYIKKLDECKLLQHLGPEPLEKEFTSQHLLNRLKNKKSTIKQLIMDNHNVVGVGNIYACESLFLAGISPLRSGESINQDEAKKLTKSIKQVLKLAIELGGSSLRDYKQADGNLGFFQNIHNVYGKAGMPCVKCATQILEKRIGQRNSFYCPTCQK